MGAYGTTNHYFNKSSEMVDCEVIAVWTANPDATTRFRAVVWHDFNAAFLLNDRLIDGFVNIEENLGTVWVDYQNVCPDLLDEGTEFEPITNEDLLETTLPLRFKGILAYRAAATLLASDGDTAGAGAFLGVANKKLAEEVSRLVVPERFKTRVRAGFGRAAA